MGNFLHDISSSETVRMPLEKNGKGNIHTNTQIHKYTITQIRIQMPLEHKNTFPWLTFMGVMFADGADELKLFTHAGLS